MHPLRDTDETHDTARTPEQVVPLKNPPSLRPLTLTQRAVVEALASGAQTQTEAAERANVSRTTVKAVAKSGQLADVYEATLRECGLSAANIKRRLWLLSHDAAEAGQYAPAVSAVVALHRDVERMEQGTTVNVQVIRIGGKDVYF
jgi:hypothetical protein